MSAALRCSCGFYANWSCIIKQWMWRLIFFLQTKCFICGIGSEYFDTVPHGFESHTLQEHNLANYLWVQEMWKTGQRSVMSLFHHPCFSVTILKAVFWWKMSLLSSWSGQRASLMSPDLHTDGRRSGLHRRFYWPSSAQEDVWLTYKATAHSSFCSVSCLWA